MVDTTALNKSVDEVTQATSGVEGARDSAIAFIKGSAAVTLAAVTKALQDDNAADQGTVDTVTGVLNGIRDRQLATVTAITDALANPSA